ncbi:MAG: NADH dehydrogenase [Armatimonadetes bacterium 13_1_40CM_3_65_7]|nr:MAG: NADH dehydrogenase [Armatimonadetes bacterium 13_1_40CM_3_65_7]
MALRTEELMLNMGPQHPSTHGVLRLIVTLDGENIVDVQPDIGYLHSSVEKMMEHRTYVQNVALVDRGMDYLIALNNEEVYCLAVERLAGIQPPERARYIRVIFSELNRIASHLVWLGTWAIDLGATTVFLWCFREREMILDLFEKVTGGRWVEECGAFLEYFLPRVDEYDKLLTENPIFLARTRGVGKITRADAIAMGASGPVGRASGIAYDVRKATPYEVYDRMEFEVPVLEDGDCFARYLVRLAEMRQAVRIIRQALRALPGGEIRTRVPMTMKAPRGEAYVHTESPRGDLGIHVVSDGGETPYRVKIRAPSFSNLYALTEMMKGWKVADVIAILGSIDIVLSDVDR